MSSPGQVIGYVGGAVVGSFFGMPMLGAAIGGMIGGAIDPPKGPNIVGPKLDDLSFQSSTLGAPLARGYGTFPVTGNVIWLEGDQYREVTTTEEQGGKGGPTQTVESTKYYATFAVSLLRVTDPNATVSLRRLWIGSNLVYEAGSDNLESIIASHVNPGGSIANQVGAFLDTTVEAFATLGPNFTFYNGADDQLPNARWQADKGIDAVSGMPGRCYIVFEDLALEKYSNSLAMAQVKAELVIADTAPVQTALVDTISVGNLGDPLWGNTIVFHGIQFNSGGARYLTTEKYIYGDDPVSLNIRSMEFPHDVDVVSRNITYPDGGYGYAWVMLHCSQFDAPVLLQLQNEFSGFTEVKYRWININEEVAWTDYVSHPDVTSSSHQSYAIDRGETFVAGANLSAKVAKLALNNMVVATTASAYSIIKLGVSENYVFGLLYTPGADNLTTTVYKFDRDTLALVATYTDNAIGGRGTIQVIDDDTFYTAASASGYGNRLYKWVDGVVVKDFGSILPNAVSKAATLAVINDNPLFGYIQDNEQVSNDPTALNIYLFSERVNAETASLRDIVTAECGLAGIASSDLDLAALTDHDVRGYRVTERGSVRAALEPLQAAFPFDVAQSGYKLRFVSRGGSSLATIPEEDLGTVATGEQSAVLLPVAREMDTQLPRKVSVRYLDFDREYDLGEQYAERPCNSVNERVVELPIVMNSQEAARTADVLLSKDWVERTEIGPFSLPPTWRAMEAADVVTVEHRGQSRIVRLTRAEYLPDGRISCNARMTASQSYTSTATGEAPAVLGQSLVPLRGSSTALLLDIPTIISQQDKPGISAAVYGRASGWPGAVILRSDDSGATYSSVLSSNVAAAVFSATTALGSGRTDIIDAANVLTLNEVSKNPTLASVSFASAAAGQNLAVIGADGRWEVVSFLTVTDNGDDTWTIRDFMRGRFGTEWAMSLHEAGDLLIVLSPSAVGFIGLPVAAINSSRLYRAVTQGASIDSAADVAYTYAATNLKPLAPIRLGGYRNPSNLDWTLTANRRSRTPVEPFSGLPTPIGEASEAYDVEIWDSTYATLKRTFSGLTSASTPYTAAQQIADFGVEQSTVYVKWHPLSATVGRGRALQASLYRYIPLDPYGDLVTLLMHMDDTGLTDVTGKSVTLFGNVAREADASAYGGYWAGFDGDGDYLRIPYASGLDVGSGDFTIQARIKVTAYRTYACMICGTYGYGSVDGGTNNDGWELGLLSDGKLFFGFGTGGGTFTYFSSANAVGTGVIKNVGVKRVGNDFTLYIEGTADGTYNSSVDFTRNNKTYFYVGSYNRGDADAFSANVSFNGKLEELRITKGVGRDLTIVPTAAFPNP